MRIYRASELGGCSKMLILKGLGYEPMDTPEEFESQYFLPGKLAEIEVLTRLEQEGEEVTDTQKEVNLVYGDVTVQGHIDGILNGRVLEIKSMSDAEFRRFQKDRWDTTGLVQRYKWQISVYMLAEKKEALVVVYNRDTGELHREGVELPWYAVEQIHLRVMGIEGAIDASQIPTVCDIPNYPCPFYYLHEDEEVEVDERLEPLAEQWMVLRQQEREVKEQLEPIRKGIIELLGANTRLRSERYQVNWSDVHNQRFNRDLARADGVDVDKYMEESITKRLTVKEKSEQQQRRKGTDTSDGGVQSREDD